MARLSPQKRAYAMVLDVFEERGSTPRALALRILEESLNLCVQLDVAEASIAKVSEYAAFIAHCRKYTKTVRDPGWNYSMLGLFMRAFAEAARFDGEHKIDSTIKRIAGTDKLVRYHKRRIRYSEAMIDASAVDEADEAE